jgi:hypothetical protein
MYEQIQMVANLAAGGVRTEWSDGREYLVAPMTLLVPGVHAGSMGPLLYELPDMEASADSWNGMPIVVNHPEQGTARSPRILEARAIGTVYKTTTYNGELVAEGWFDVAKTRKVDARILNWLRSGRKF